MYSVVSKCSKKFDLFYTPDLDKRRYHDFAVGGATTLLHTQCW